jgi:hypothetical protein
MFVRGKPPQCVCRVHVCMWVCVCVCVCVCERAHTHPVFSRSSTRSWAFSPCPCGHKVFASAWSWPSPRPAFSHRLGPWSRFREVSGGFGGFDEVIRQAPGQTSLGKPKKNSFYLWLGVSRRYKNKEFGNIL